MQVEQLKSWQEIKNTINQWYEQGEYQETEAMKFLKMVEIHKRKSDIDEQDLKENEALLLSLLAKSRVNRTGKYDHISEKWLKIALEISPSLNLANTLLTNSIKSHLSGKLDFIQFPTIRETDSRPGKRKAAEDIISICEQFYDKHSTLLELLNQVNVTVQVTHSSTDEPKREEMESPTLNDIFKEITVLFSSLQNSSEEYKNSLTGVFHTSNHLQSVKYYMSQILQLKKQWDLTLPTKELSNKKSDSLRELNEMIGLHDVKQRVHKLYHFLKYQKRRKELGFSVKDELSLNMILTGNPGTGKTTLARLLAKIYFELGLLPKQEVKEVDRSQLVGAYVGQTEENTKNMIKEALGGVLFIDEAYSLKREGQTGNDFGQTAIDTLVSAMTSGEYAGKFAIILAGYPEEMRQFLWANPGLRSRFPESNHIHLPNYKNDELIQIAEQTALENDYTLTEAAVTELKSRIEKEQVDESFGNARTVKNIVLDAIFSKGASYTEDDYDISDFTILSKEDFKTEEVNSQDEQPLKLLDSLIGIESVKEEVKSLSSYIQIQQSRREQGLPTLPVQLHSVFSGNPGTGKTTVAEIFAKILHQCGYLKRGHLIVASRADLVAGYVGQTAIKTKKKIREALGGVLFIDEAYSLSSGGNQDFGKEAVDTLVDEMTKHNDNLVVILSGYPGEMKRLLDVNPGLKSRFKKFFEFPDYHSNELVQIADHYVKLYGYQLDKDAKFYLLKQFEQTTVEGNGRYITNLIDEAVQIQAHRIMSENSGDMSLLKKQDIVQAHAMKER